MIATDFGADFDRIRAAMSEDYPRAADIPGAGLEIVADAGHIPTLEQPAAVIEALRAWLDQEPGARE